MPVRIKDNTRRVKETQPDISFISTTHCEYAFNFANGKGRKNTLAGYP